jgi:ABC-2 type transport system permease protein
MFRAELLGLVTTTATKVTALVAVVGLIVTQLAFVTLMPALADGDIGPGLDALGSDFPVLDLASRAVQLDALNPLGASMGNGSIGVALIAITLLGVLAGTSDDRYGGIVGAVLASPKRFRIVAAKAGAVALIGAVLGVVLALVSLVTLVITLATTGTPFVLGFADLAARLGLGVLAVTALAVVGLAIGLIVRTQLAGVLTMIAILILEPVVVSVIQLVTGGVLPVWTQFLPVALAQGVIHGGTDGLGPSVVIIALVALTAALTAAASAALSRRDI